MRPVRYITLLLLFTATLLQAAPRSVVSWSSSVVATQDKGVYDVTFDARIEPGWHIYDLGPYEGAPNPTLFSFEDTASVRLLGKIHEAIPSAKGVDRVLGKRVGYYKLAASFTQRVGITSPGETFTVTVEFQACDDKQCLSPEEYTFEITVGDPANKTGAPGAVKTPSTPAPGDDGIPWKNIVEAILWGFAALITPCVFPMVPLTVSFFTGNGKGRGVAAPLIFGLSIVLLFTLPVAVISIIAGITGGGGSNASLLNAFSTHWIPNVLFFLVFMLFAASFFGLFEIRLPGWIVNKSNARADKGGIFSIFFIALTLVLVSFSCTGPIIGSVLLLSANGGLWEPLVTMLVFSMAFALPFVVIAIFPSLLSSIPRSGRWLHDVKMALGFIEVALGLKFLSVADQVYHWGILTREVYLILWIVVFTLMGLYFTGIFDRRGSARRAVAARVTVPILSFLFVAYLASGLFGAPLKTLSGYLPPQKALPSIKTTHSPKWGDILTIPHGLKGFFDYDEAETFARNSGKPLFINFTGHGCVNCREMEARVLSDPRVIAILEEYYVLLFLYVDDRSKLQEAEWVTTPEGNVIKRLGRLNSYIASTRFGVNSQPLYILQDAYGNNLAPPLGYDLDVEVFIDFLKNGLRAFRDTGR